MNWQNNEFLFEENISDSPRNINESNDSQTVYEQNEQKKLIQIRSLQDPKKDQQIQSYISIVSRFGDLLKNTDKEETDLETILMEDFEIFLFNLAEVRAVQYANNRKEFIRLYKEFQIIQRNVKELYVDKEKQTIIQICFCKIFIEKEKKIIEQFSCEVFSINNDQIRKYRASFGVGSSLTEFQNPFEPSRKDIMLAKINELNYAWVGQPDLDKIASLLHDSIEYKIWSWESQKGSIFSKSDFATNFKNLEQNYSLKCVVPYEVYSEGQFIIGTYVFHLEGKKDLAGQKFMWLSTCIYTFDRDLNIAKVNQQGELHLEDELLIPFAGSSREDLMQLVQTVFNFKDAPISEWSLVNNDKFHFSFEMTRLGPSIAPNIGTVKGFSEFERLSKILNAKHRHMEWTKTIDVYIDCYSPGYDVVILVDCAKGCITNEKSEYSEKVMNFYRVRKLCFENGKGAKAVSFFSEIPEEIPSPYDDISFSCINIKNKDKTIGFI